MASSPKTWGYALVAPGRPTLDQQLVTIAALGVDTGETGTLWIDRIDRGKRGRNAGQTQLTARNDLLACVQSGDRVIVADPLCLGISAGDAEWFLTDLAGRGVTVIVNGQLYQIAPGADLSEIIEEVARRQNAANVAASRARRR